MVVHVDKKKVNKSYGGQKVTLLRQKRLVIFLAVFIGAGYYVVSNLSSGSLLTRNQNFVIRGEETLLGIPQTRTGVAVDASAAVAFHRGILTREDLTTMFGSTTSEVHFVVWTFPFPPPLPSPLSHDGRSTIKGRETIFICHYDHACRREDEDGHLHHPSHQEGSVFQVNLRSLTEGTYWHHYIRDHAYHKVRHLKTFPWHVQAITMLSILSILPDACIQTWGSEQLFCGSSSRDSRGVTSFSNYDPYQLDFGDSNFPLELAGLQQPNDSNNSHFMVPLGDWLDQEQFGMWGYDFGNDPYSTSKYPAGQFNSGEDVQSFASVTWYPFLNSVVNKQKALTYFKGHYVANSLASVWDTPSAEETNQEALKRVVLLSIYLGQMTNVEKNADFIRKYTYVVGEAFGARSTATERQLISLRIKSYFSACLTLTTNLQGAQLDPQTPKCDSLLCQDLVFPKPPISNRDDRNLAPSQEKSLILMVDVMDAAAIPAAVRDKALKFSANIPKQYPKNMTQGFLTRMEYSYRLLSLYASQTKLIITSRIHVGLPAAAMGVPVVFVEKGNWLPGGKQSVGRVEGLLDVFHRVDVGNGKHWPLGENITATSAAIPPNPGNHRADRYRASFWNRLQRTSSFYKDAAKLFGMIPFQRLGKQNTRNDLHSVFHFMWDAESSRQWHVKRAIEHIFFFHPNSRLYIHTGDVAAAVNDAFLRTLAESGYDVVCQEFDPVSLVSEVAEKDRESFAASREVMEREYPFFLIWKYGGVFVSRNLHITQELPLSLKSALVRDTSGKVVFLIQVEKQESLEGTMAMMSRLEASSSSKILVSFSAKETASCIDIEDTEKKVVVSAEQKQELEQGNLFGVVIDYETASQRTLMYGSLCHDLIHKTCIFCDEVHWEFPPIPSEKFSA